MHALPKWLIRLVGISGLTVLSLFLFFTTVGRLDIGWALPWTKPFRAHWPDLPIFASWKAKTPEGRDETIYQVPTHQLTREEIARLRYTPPATNAAAAISSPPAAQ